MTLQDLIFKLSEFWATRGCLLQQPLDIELGAGTMHPETFLRVLGPEPWNVAYVQPSRRPADGRFGENPNRLFKHHQFQVILKPAPDDVQELYLQSLEACGIDLRAHDVRFEEDNWESPTLGAWGIGWQVMLDGQEITQFTYFQQAGGIDLAPISVEITYGLERIAMSLQDVDNVYDLEWAPGVTYRDVRHRDEVEQSKYAFGQVDMPKDEFAGSTATCSSSTTLLRRRCCDSGPGAAGARLLPEVLAPVQPARRERQHRRDRAHGLHPAGPAAGGGDREEVGRVETTATAITKITKVPRSQRKPDDSWTVSVAFVRRRGPVGCMDRELLLEIGVEELPASWLPALTEQLAEKLQARLKEMRLSPDAPVESFSTPRRLTARDRPHAGAAGGPRRDRHGAAGVGGVRRRRPADERGARIREEAGRRLRGARARRRPPKGEYLAVTKQHRGKSTVDALPDVLGALLRDLTFPKQMHWDAELEDGKGEFAVRPADPLAAVSLRRPRRAVHASRARRWPRAARPGRHVGRRHLRASLPRDERARRPGDQGAHLRRVPREAAGALRHPRSRRAARSDRARARGARRASWAAACTCASRRRCSTRSPISSSIPGVVAGFFERGFLELPHEVLTTTLMHHQHYFPVLTDERRAEGGVPRGRRTRSRRTSG